MGIALFFLAILPGLLITWYIYHKDKYQRENPLNLVICFGLGMLVTLPVITMEQWAHDSGLFATDRLEVILFSSFVVVALSEELVKFLVLTLYPYRQAFFNEPIDGIIYAVSIAMGFATLENVIYALRYGLETTIMRAILAVPAHAAFGVIMGYFVGKGKFRPARRKRWLTLGLLVPLFLHGTYDFLILQEAWDQLIILVVPLLALSIFVANKLIREQQERSPFKPGAKPSGEDGPGEGAGS